MVAKRLAAGLLAAGVMALAPAAGAAGWQEMHETSDDVHFEIGPDGIATVQHHLRYRIVAGRFKTFEIAGIHPAAELAPEAVFVSDKTGAEVLARVEAIAPKPDKGDDATTSSAKRPSDGSVKPITVRLMIDEGKGLGRGSYTVDIRYRLDLVATRLLARDGAMWRIAWTSPPAPDPHDGARVVFDLPAAPTEPRLAGASGSTTLATLRRSAERDELELVRAHVPRGEAVTWAARVDPKAFPRVTSPELRPPPIPETAPPSLIASNLSRIIASAGIALLAGALAALLRWKQRSVRAAAELRRATARPLLPLPWGTGPFAYGVVAASGLASLLWWSPLAGALLVVLAMAIGSHRAPATVTRARGPGSWRPMADSLLLVAAAPEPLPTDPLDGTTRRGLVAFVAVACAFATWAWLLRAHVPQIAIALPLLFAAIVPVFFTGTRAQMAPTPIELAVRMLLPSRDALAGIIDLEHAELATLARVIEGKEGQHESVDEVRLTCVPRDRTPGLRAIELALATSPGCHGATPEVFVRFDDGSAAAERVARLAAGVPVMSGRVAEERVVRLSPDEPTPVAAAALVGALVLALEGRRATDRANAEPVRVRWTGVERRGRLLARPGLVGAAAAGGVTGA
jgi:hypothetical protein